jgi:flagellar biogenesis protein FliO
MPEHLTIALIIFSATFLAAEEKKNDYGRWQPPKGMPELSLGYLLFVFVMIATAIVLVLWLAKKWQGCRFASARRLILKESLYLGNKTFLHAVEIDGRLVVLGVGPQPIQVISEAVPPESSAPDRVLAAGSGSRNSFVQFAPMLQAAEMSASSVPQPDVPLAALPTSEGKTR